MIEKALSHMCMLFTCTCVFRESEREADLSIAFDAVAAVLPTERVSNRGAERVAFASVCLILYICAPLFGNAKRIFSQSASNAAYKI